jgi:hypothetical protein
MVAHSAAGEPRPDEKPGRFFVDALWVLQLSGRISVNQSESLHSCLVLIALDDLHTLPLMGHFSAIIGLLMH